MGYRVAKEQTEFENKGNLHIRKATTNNIIIIYFTQAKNK